MQACSTLYTVRHFQNEEAYLAYLMCDTENNYIEDPTSSILKATDPGANVLVRAVSSFSRLKRTSVHLI